MRLYRVQFVVIKYRAAVRCGAFTLLSNISCCHGDASLTLRQVININTQHDNGHSWTVRATPPPSPPHDHSRE